MTIPSGVMPPAAPGSGAKGVTTGDGTDPATGDAFAALVATFLPRQLPQQVPDQQPKGGAIPGLTQTTPGGAAQLVAVDATPAAQEPTAISLDTPPADGAATTPVAAGIDLTDAKPSGPAHPPTGTDAATPPASQGLSHRSSAAHMPPDVAPAVGLRGRSTDAVVPDTASGTPASAPAVAPTTAAEATPAAPGTPDAAPGGPAVASPTSPVTMPAGQEAHASATALARSHGQWGGAERATDDAGHAKAGHAKAAPAGPATPTSAPAGSLAPATPAGNAHSGTDDDKDAQDAPSSSAPVGATDHVARPATPAVIHTDAVQRATPSTRPEPATPPHQQIVSVVEPLRRRGDGSYQVTLRLNPEDLGPVDLHVQLHHDAIELHMHTDHDHARAMLNEHLGDLRHELTEAGFRPTTVDVSDGRSRQQSPTFSTPQTPTGPSTGVSTASQPVAPVTVGATSQSTDNLDVRI